MQRAEDLLQIYAFENELTEEHIDILWEASQTDESAKIEIFKMISDCTKDMQDEIVDVFIKKVQSVDPGIITMRDVDLVYNLGKNSFMRAAARETAANTLWQIALLQKPGYPKAILKPTRKHLQNLMRNQDRDMKITVIKRCIELISNP